ncbi:hypothetical protein CON64_19005 [Bacillus pseudomycoides]|nr:hypothetical protein CON64_19005 [Bacillus pseudomycoides]
MRGLKQKEKARAYHVVFFITTISMTKNENGFIYISPPASKVKKADVRCHLPPPYLIIFQS